jgi:hypothetical protein
MPMSHQNPALKRYIRSIRKILPCSGKMKKNIISQISETIEDYLLQDPTADLETIQAHFGTPQKIAAHCMDGQDTFAQWKKIRNKKRILSVTAGLMAALFLLGAGFLAWKTRSNQSQSIGYITVVVTQDP